MQSQLGNAKKYMAGVWSGDQTCINWTKLNQQTWLMLWSNTIHNKHITYKSFESSQIHHWSKTSQSNTESLDYLKGNMWVNFISNAVTLSGCVWLEVMWWDCELTIMGVVPSMVKTVAWYSAFNEHSAFSKHRTGMLCKVNNTLPTVKIHYMKCHQFRLHLSCWFFAP